MKALDEQGKPRTPLVQSVGADSEGAPLVVVGLPENPLAVVTPAGWPMSVQEGRGPADGNPSHTHGITASAVTHATAGPGMYVLKAVDNGCYVRWDGGTCTKSVGGFSYHVSEGEALKVYLPGDSISIINTAAGFLTVLPLF